MKLRRIVFATVLLLSGAGATEARVPVIDYLPSADKHDGGILDIRSEALCRKGSLPRARCLPITEFVGPHRRLANFSGMLWLLGSAGLTGEEHLLLVGDVLADKELMAGLLYLTGQRRISILEPSSDAWARVADLRPGRIRSKTRERVYTAPMRDDHIILRDELRRLIDSRNAPPLIDGRTESEYWGQRVRALRGGHLPGAQLLPAGSVTGGGQDVKVQGFDHTNPWIVYGHDAAEGLIYLARLLASGIEPRLYLEGWVGWASDGALPADSLTYRDAPVRGARKTESAVEQFPWALVLGAALAGTALAVGGFYIGRMTAR